MAAIDYHGILTTLKTLLEADATLAGVPVRVEEDPTFDLAGAGTALVIMLNSRRESPGQPLAAGKRIRWHIRVSVWSVGYGLSFEEAAQRRDSLVGALELVLMKNRTVSDKVGAGWVEGGDFLTVRATDGNYALAETVLVGEAVAIAT